MKFYEFAILGDASDDERRTLVETLSEMLKPYDLQIGRDVSVYDGASIAGMDKKLAFAATYFRGRKHPDEAVARQISNASLPIIPVVGAEETFETSVPEILSLANGYRLTDTDPKMLRLATALLECVGLLERQRRVFVSYRRTESRAAAVQLHDELSGLGFDVFLDTHTMQPGEPFQESLWHRLCDCDVMVVLDTKTYFERKWTRLEYARAQAMGIQVLRVVWPNHTSEAQTDLAETIFLSDAEFDELGTLVDGTVKQIANTLELLRSKTVAARYMAITGKLRAEAAAIGAHFEGIGAYRSIAISLPQGKRVYAYPVVGVPSANLLNDVAMKAHDAGQGTDGVLIYDHLGIKSSWMKHLGWLDDNISTVKAVKVREASVYLPEL